MQGSAHQNARFIKKLIWYILNYGYYPKLEKSWHFCLEEEELAACWNFNAEGLTVRYSDSHHCFSVFRDTQEKLNEWVELQVVAWVEGGKFLAQVAPMYPQMDYTSLEMSLQLEWQ